AVVHLNEATGELTTTFEETPQLPFTLFKLTFSGGARAALATPTQCGTYGEAQGFSATFESWSAPAIGDAFPRADFLVNEGADGAGCPASPLPFSPTLTAGGASAPARGCPHLLL